MSEEVGRITISLNDTGTPEITMMGQISGRQYRALPVYMKRAFRKHTAAVRRGNGPVVIEDTGKKLEDYKSEEEFSAVEPAAAPSAAEGLQVPSVNLAPVANESKPKELEEDGNDEGTEAVRGDDEESGSEKRSWRK